MDALNEMFLRKYDLLVKRLVADQIDYLEQMQTRPLSHAGIGY